VLLLLLLLPVSAYSAVARSIVCFDVLETASRAGLVLHGLLSVIGRRGTQASTASDNKPNSDTRASAFT
jgi:hypothetical protein